MARLPDTPLQAARKLGGPGVARDVRHFGAFAVVVVSLLLARYAYFGQWLPNTYFAKPSGTFGLPGQSGYGYCLEAASLVHPVWLLLAGVYLVLALTRRASASMHVTALSSLPLIGFALYTGGDWMPRYRFLVPIVPSVLLLGVSVLAFAFEFAEQRAGGTPRRLIPRTRWARGLLAGLGGLVAVSVYHQIADQRAILANQDRFPIDLMNSGERNTALADWLASHFARGTTIATKRIGAVPYLTGFRTLDLYGLIDPEISAVIGGAGSIRNDAVAKRIASAVIGEEPEIILLHTKKPGERIQPRGRQETALYWRMGERYEILGCYPFSAGYFTCPFVNREVRTIDQLNALKGSFAAMAALGR